jgi:neutral amino acid transport system ATP-binding protein
VSAAPILRVESLVAGYNDVNILHDVSIVVEPGSFVSVIGPNGAGKSTLLKAIYGIVKPRGGAVSFGTKDVTGLKPHRITKLGMNYVPQLANVFPRLSIYENLEVGATTTGRAASKRIELVLEAFPILRDRRRQRAETLSGGQRQMLALARALVTEPELLLLDEPSAGLAPLVVDELFAKLLEINEQGIAILMVEQNARRSLALSRYSYVLDMGRNHFEGPGPELLRDPKVVDLYLGGRGRISTAGAALTAGEELEAVEED